MKKYTRLEFNHSKLPTSDCGWELWAEALSEALRSGDNTLLPKGITFLSSRCDRTAREALSTCDETGDS